MSHPWPRQSDPSEDGPTTPRTATPNDELQHMLSPSLQPPDSPFNPGYALQDMQPLRSATASRSLSTTQFVSSPLNPATPIQSPFARSRPGSGSSIHRNRMASEDSQITNSPFSSSGNRGSMVLWHFPTDEMGALVPPKFSRHSVMSTSGDSIFSLNAESKYPLGLMNQRGIVPYAYDPADDLNEPPDEEDKLHDPNNDQVYKKTFPWRGLLNVGVLTALTAGVLILFIFYPVLSYFRDAARRLAIDGNIRINSTGQVPELFQIPSMIDPATPDSVKSRQGFDGHQYELVFSDEFNEEGRTFNPGEDAYWEAVDLWYGDTDDLEWYDPKQVTTSNGNLVITMESVADPTQNHGLQYRSGMLQSWNKFCFTTGYIEVSMTLPGPNSNAQGYWPGVWTMGNLGRPGYTATTEGVWPYSYDSCDVGTFPNQTYANHSGPAAALYSDMSRAKYNYELSWLPGQKLSSCTCPGEQHPGPSNSVGRGAPEIDVLEAELNKVTGIGQTVSQSAQLAPFSHDYVYLNNTPDEFTIYNPSITFPNSYRGSALQQAVSALTQVPDDMFQGSGQRFVSFGFEYWSDPSNRDEGFITWQSNGVQSVRLGATSMAADDATGISQRLISEEPMAIVLNLGISPDWQTIDLASLEFPAVMLIDYIRVYQRQGQINYGCDPRDRPTADYINAHLDAYTNPNVTTWISPWPKNSLYSGGC